jgi:hypothetical protein
VRVLDEWPWGIAFGCDFVDRTRITVAPGERCVDLQVDCEELPGTGILVLHERTVRDMVIHLGWKLDDADSLRDEMLRVIGLNEALHEENEALRKALTIAARKPTEIPRVLVP